MDRRVRAACWRPRSSKWWIHEDQKDALAELFSRIYFDALFDLAGGNQSEAARISEMDRSYLRKLLHKYGVGS
jgi:DNA-binding protein Fis